jgi:hypothetical protein
MRRHACGLEAGPAVDETWPILARLIAKLEQRKMEYGNDSSQTGP